MAYGSGFPAAILEVLQDSFELLSVPQDDISEVCPDEAPVLRDGDSLNGCSAIVAVVLLQHAWYWNKRKIDRLLDDRVIGRCFQVQGESCLDHAPKVLRSAFSIAHKNPSSNLPFARLASTTMFRNVRS